MWGLLSQRSLLHAFDKAVVPRAHDVPQLGLAAFDRLMATPVSELVAKTANAKTDSLPEPLAGLAALSDEDAGVSLAALIMLYARSRPVLRQMEALHKARHGRIVWTAETARLMLETWPEREEAPDHKTVEVLEASFPQGAPASVRAAVAAFIDHIPHTDGPLHSYQIALIRRLERLAGRDPDRNAHVSQFNAGVAAYRQAQAEVLPKLGPQMRTALDHLQADGRLDDAFARSWAESRADLSPGARGALLLDAMRIDALYAHPGRRGAEHQAEPAPPFLVGNGDRELRGLALDLQNAPVALTDAQAKEMVRLLFRGAGSRETLLSGTKPQFAAALQQGIETPDAELAAQLREALGYWGRRDLLALADTLCPIARVAEPVDTGLPKLLHAVAVAKRRLDLAFVRWPGMWVTTPRWEASDRSRLNGQLFPYSQEVDGYLRRISDAADRGFDVAAELARVKEMLRQATENLALVAAGDFVPRDLSSTAVNFPKGETFRTSNPYYYKGSLEWLAAEKDVFDATGKPLVRLIQRIETQYLRNLDAEIAKVEAKRTKGLLGRLPGEMMPGQHATAPTKAWIGQARNLLSGEDLERFLDMIATYQPQVDAWAAIDDGEIAEFTEWFPLQSNWQGIVWASHLAGARAVQTLYDFAKRAFAKVPGKGIRAAKLGTAAIHALALVDGAAGLPSLLRLQREVAYPQIRKAITRRLEEAAQAAGITRTDLEELSAKDHGLTSCERRIPLTLGAAVLRAQNGKVLLTWEDATGAACKTLPVSLKSGDPDGVNAARLLFKEIETDLVTWKRLYEVGYLANRGWSYEIWRSRHADHGTRSLLARRLLWTAERDGKRVTVLPTGANCIGRNGKTVNCADARMSLWHPLDAAPDEIEDWRNLLAARAIEQPFRQVWRETYRLTDAERQTALYSNRFAGHVLRQHQFRALATANGWTSPLVTGFYKDEEEVAYIQLPELGLQAEFWAAPVAKNSPQSHGGSYLYLTSDRIRFHKLAPKSRFGRGAAVPLDKLPPLVLSEILRAGDLFTSVASIGLDPEWADVGTDAEGPGEWRNIADAYWRDRQTAPLAGSATLRRRVLERLLPNMKPPGVFTLDETHLQIKGKLHRYRIHLGSAAVHIIETGQHLCIVPKQGNKAKVMLPFDDDVVLSLILSKALLLSQDDRITDAGLTRQLQ